MYTVTQREAASTSETPQDSSVVRGIFIIFFFLDLILVDILHSDHFHIFPLVMLSLEVRV